MFPLLKAASAGKRDMLVLLLDYGAKINQKRPGDGMDALAVACLEGHLAIVDMLVARNAAVEPQDLSHAIGAGTSRSRSGRWTPRGSRADLQRRQDYRGRPRITRPDARRLEALLQRYGARRTQSHTQNAAPAER